MTTPARADSSAMQEERAKQERLELRQQMGALALDQGEFGEAWIRVLAAAAGLDCAQHRVERGVSDFILTFPAAIGPLPEWSIKAQVKTVAEPKYDRGSIVYDLEADAHRRLAGLSQTPSFLFVVTVGSCRDSWVRGWGHADTLSYGAYWLSLREHERTTNESTQRVRVPLTNRLSPERVKWLCTATAENYLVQISTGGGTP